MVRYIHTLTHIQTYKDTYIQNTYMHTYVCIMQIYVYVHTYIIFNVHAFTHIVYAIMHTCQLRSVCVLDRYIQCVFLYFGVKTEISNGVL